MSFYKAITTPCVTFAVLQSFKFKLINRENKRFKKKNKEKGKCKSICKTKKLSMNEFLDRKATAIRERK